MGMQIKVDEYLSGAGLGFQVRKYYTTEAHPETLLPSRKGIFLTIEQWKEIIPQLCEKINCYPERSEMSK